MSVRGRVAVLCAIVAATVAAYASLAGAGWCNLDDPLYVTENPHVKAGLRASSLAWALTAGHASNWHPLTWWSHMLDVELFGLDPGRHHLVNLGLHLVDSVLVALLLARLTGRFAASAACAAVFALHPLHVESVAWVSERKDVLSALLFLLTVWAWVRWTERPTQARYVLAMALFALGLMAKPMLVTLPCVLLLLDVWPLRRLVPDAADVRAALRARVVEKLPLFVLVAVSSVVTWRVQAASGAVATLETIPVAARLANALVSLVRYLGHTVWPVSLAIPYPHPGRVELASATLALLGLAALTALAVRTFKTRPWILVGWLWYVGMLVPVIGIVQVGTQALADRYMYLPMIGLLIAVVFTLDDLLAKPRDRAVVAAAGVALAGVLTVATSRQAALWRDSVTLFSHTLGVTGGANGLARECLGHALLERGDTDGAIRHLTEAVRLSPGSVDAQNNLAAALAVRERFAEAIPHFEAAARLKPTDAGIHDNLGFAQGNAGEREAAIASYEAALRIDASLVRPRKRLGLTLASLSRLEAALPHLQRASAADPGDAETRRALATALTLLGRVEEAIAEYRRLVAADPDDLDARNNIAWIRATHAEAAHRDAAEAVREAEAARDRDTSRNAVLRDTLAAAYAEAGRFDDAVRVAEEASALARGSGDATAAERFAAHAVRYRTRRALRLPE